MEDLWRLTAVEMAKAVAAGQATAQDLVEAHLDRIEAVNPIVNAIVAVAADEAREQARRADEAVLAGSPLGPLHGVPFTVKANIDVQGHATTWGTPAFADAIAPMDAPVVQRMREAGAIMLGQTNLPNMALRVDTGSTLYGHTSNPWDRARTAGGSSGGEAAALATGMSPIGLGNDIGGSLRNPANACGIASIKPTAGRVPDAQSIPGPDRLFVNQAFNVQGPMARTVDDVRAALRVLIGAHERDPWAIDAPFEGKPRPDGRPKVALCLTGFGKLDPAVAAAVRRAGDALSDAGYEVAEVAPPHIPEVMDLWARILLGDFGLVLPDLEPFLGDKGKAFFGGFGMGVPVLNDAADMSRLLMRRDMLAREWSGFLARYPLVLTPTWTELPFELGLDTETQEGARKIRDLIGPVAPANLLGLPSACVPALRDGPTGLPVGVLLTGRWFREDECLTAAEAIEARSELRTPIDPIPSKL